MNDLNTFIVDAETDGLDDPFLSVAAIVYNEQLEEQAVYYGAVANAASQIPWIQENVLPFLSNAPRQLPDEEALLKEFAQFWLAHRENARVIADVACPVEARLFLRCVKAAGLPPTEYPYPIIDLASMLLQAGIDPDTDRQTLSGMPIDKHDALSDVRGTARILRRLTQKPEPLTEDRRVFSYHTFVFPFLWDDSGSIKRETFLKCIHHDWQEDRFSPENQTTPMVYNQYHYFNKAAMNAVYWDKTAGKDAVVWNYTMPTMRGTKYVIQKQVSSIFYHYELEVNQLRLRLYNTGVGLLVFELENYRNWLPDDICRINDLGRRIYSPYFDDKGRCSICADEIHLGHAQEKFTDGGYQNAAGTRIMEPVMGLLRNGNYTCTTDEKARSKHCFFIEPVIDDRMFTACFYWNPDHVNYLTARCGGNYRYLADALSKPSGAAGNAAADLYKLVFIDGGSCTCQSRTMLHDALRHHIYDRWVECGTLTGISDYSMVELSSCNEDYLVFPFLTQYVEMMTLALAQRASLLAFERRISDASLRKQDVGKIQKQYTLFQSQLLLQEVTPQQQGIELYDRLRETLFIPKQQKEIESQIANLFAAENDSSANRQNILLFLLTALGLFETVQIVFGQIFPCAPGWVQAVTSGILIVVAFVVFFCMQSFNRKK